MSGVVQRRNDLLTVTQRGLSLFKQIYDVYLYTLGTHEKSKRKPSGQFFQSLVVYTHTHTHTHIYTCRNIHDCSENIYAVNVCYILYIIYEVIIYYTVNIYYICNEYIIYIVYAVNIYNICSEYMHIYTQTHTHFGKSHTCKQQKSCFRRALSQQACLE